MVACVPNPRKRVPSLRFDTLNAGNAAEISIEAVDSLLVLGCIYDCQRIFKVKRRERCPQIQGIKNRALVWQPQVRLSNEGAGQSDGLSRRQPILT